MNSIELGEQFMPVGTLPLPTMTPSVQYALAIGNKAFFEKIKSKDKKIDISNQYALVFRSESFFSTRKKQCILSYAGSFRQFELCQFFLMSHEWRALTESLLFKKNLRSKMELKTISKLLYHWALETNNRLFLDYLETQFTKNVNKKSLDSVLEKMNDLHLFPKEMSVLIASYLNPCESPIISKSQLF